MSNKIQIEGGNTLSGKINISGAKNAVLALLPATILSEGDTKIFNVPNISDTEAIMDIVKYLGGTISCEKDVIKVNTKNLINKEIPEKMSSKLRASYYFMSALLGRFKHVEMYFPGGCSIGARPIDQTLKGYKALGATVTEKNTKYIIDATELHGAHIYLDMPSVGATVNTMLVAVRAKGVTTIENAAREPEIVNLAIFLNNMGANIKGAGTSAIKITGVDTLSGCFGEVIPDRIEAGTYVIAGALMGDNLKIDNIIPEHIETLTSKLGEMGVPLKIEESSITVSKSDKYEPVKVKTLGYPGFATDLQQPLTALLTQCNGISYLEETIYENRFKNVKYLNNMGANIKINKAGNKIIIKGPSKLKGKNVMATDLRAGACMVLAALKASGKTTINEIEHVLRGYEDLVGKLSSVGAKIKLIK